MKKTFTVVSSLAMLLAFSPVGSASTELVKSEPSKSVVSVSQSGNGKSLASEITKLDKQTLKANQRALKKQVDTLSDTEFDKFMHNYVKENKNYLSSSELTNRLNMLGIEFSMKDRATPEFSAQAIGVDQITLSSYSAKRGGDSYYRLYISWDSSVSEARPGSYDLVSIEWDPTVGAYYDANVGDTTKATKRDGSRRTSGIYLFNVLDNKLDFDTYATVYVTPKKSGWLEYGSKYTHTYSKTSTSTTVGAAFNYATAGSTGGLTYNVTLSETEASWDKWDDNAVNLP